MKVRFIAIGGAVMHNLAIVLHEKGFKVTVEAVAARYPGRDVIACLELHTYSSLNNDFLPQYKGTPDQASAAFVYFNPHAASLKKIKPLSKLLVNEAFAGSDIKVYYNSSDLYSSM